MLVKDVPVVFKQAELTRLKWGGQNFVLKPLFAAEKSGQAEGTYRKICYLLQWPSLATDFLCCNLYFISSLTKKTLRKFHFKRALFSLNFLFGSYRSFPC